ncbi:hypothetical protein CRM82_21080 [Comamonas terrigena]|uniref:Uncharacterized protein n=1 Tax=Comamonas terrigena TaxID=32013 RepID=A0A2A7UZP8_COMTR|nr:hypothetical protein CRM82_21080 [Comamonas terrigena]
MTGTANLRTDVKADVMQEVLGRFEAQFEKVQSPPGQASKKAPAAKRAPGKADIAMRGVNAPPPGSWRAPNARQPIWRRRSCSRAPPPPSLPPKTRNTLCGNPNRHHLRRQDGPHQGSRRTRQNPGQGSARYRSQEICRSERPRQAQQPQGR